MKKSYHAIGKQGKVDEQELTGFLVKNGRALLPMVDLIEQQKGTTQLLLPVGTAIPLQPFSRRFAS